jgi:carbamoyltransferase
VREKLFQKANLSEELERFGPKFDFQNRLLFTEHHLSHAASAFYPSPFSTAAVLTMDGVGEWATTSVAVGIAAMPRNRDSFAGTSTISDGFPAFP